MSDPVADALAARAQGASAAPPSSGDPVMDALSEVASGRYKEARSRNQSPSLGMAPVGGAEMALRRITSVPAGAIGGLAYAGTAVGRALGLDVDPSKTMADVSEYLTYDPVSESGKGGEELLGRGVHAALDPVAKLADQAATKTGKVSPFAESMMREALPASQAAGSLLGLSPLASPVLNAARAAPGAALSGVRKAAESTVSAGRKIAQAGEAASDTTVRALGGSPRAAAILKSAEASENPFAQQSMGAAAVAPAVENLSPELRAEIHQQVARGGVDRPSLERQIEADTLPVRMQLTEGQATQDPVRLSHEQNARGKNPELAHVFNEQNRQLVDNLDEIRAAASPTAVHLDPVQSGQALIDSYKAWDEPIRADITAKYKALEEANGGQFPVNGSEFVASADAALKKKMKGRYVPSQIAGDLEEFRSTGAMSFEQFENLRTNLAAEARKADQSRDGNALMAVNLVRDALEDLPMSEAAAPVKRLADAARSSAKARHDRLKADPAYREAVDDGVAMGEPSPAADKFIEKHVVKSKSAHLKVMREHLGADPSANELISGGALNYLKSKAGINAYTNEGNFSQAGYNRALAEITPKLNDLVGEHTAEQVISLGNVARFTQAQPRGSFVNNSNTFTAAIAGHAANAAEGMANVAAHGIPVGTVVRKKLQARAERKYVENAIKPGAGIQMRQLMKPEKKK